MAAEPSVPLVVCESIFEAFSWKDAERILREMQYSFMGCWLFSFAGMVVGVESDGYIHS